MPVPPLTLSIDGAVAEATLSAPEQMNRFTVAMRNSLVEALDVVSAHSGVRVFVLKAEGDHFCVGGDVNEFGTASSIHEARRARWLVDPWLPLWNLHVPTVAALKGYTLGSGLEMAMFCDLRIASATTAIALPELSIGMLPAAGGTQTIGRLARTGQALHLATSDRIFDAREALDLGLIHEISDSLDSRVEEIAQRLADLPPESVLAARLAVKSAFDLPLPAGLSKEKRLARLVRQGYRVEGNPAGSLQDATAFDEPSS